jgi:hypothetical protein
LSAGKRFGALLQADVELGAVVDRVHSNAELLRQREQLCRVKRRRAITTRHKYRVTACEGLHEQIGARFASGVDEGVEGKVQRQLNILPCALSGASMECARA